MGRYDSLIWLSAYYCDCLTDADSVDYMYNNDVMWTAGASLSRQIRLRQRLEHKWPALLYQHK